MFSFLILLTGERIEIEIKMDRRRRVVVLLQIKMKWVGVSTKSAHMRWDNTKLRVTPAVKAQE